MILSWRTSTLILGSIEGASGILTTWSLMANYRSLKMVAPMCCKMYLNISLWTSQKHYPISYL